MMTTLFKPKTALRFYIFYFYFFFRCLLHFVRKLTKKKNSEQSKIKKVLFFGKANNFLLAGWLAGWGEAVTE